MTEHPGAAGVGAAVRALRHRRGMSLRALAGELGVSAGTVSAIENGKVSVTVGRLGDLAAVLGVAPADLVDYPGQAPAPPVAGGGDGGAWRVFDGGAPVDPVSAAAVDVFAEVGYHGATMRIIADAAGTSVAGIYRNHRSKQRILVTLADALYAEQAWRTAAAVAGAGGERAAAFAAVIEALTLCHAHRRDLAFVVETELRSLEEPDLSRLLAARADLVRIAAEAAVDAAAAGEFTTPDPAGSAAAMVSLCRALPVRLAVGRRESPERWASKYTAIALSAMR